MDTTGFDYFGVCDLHAAGLPCAKHKTPKVIVSPYAPGMYEFQDPKGRLYSVGITPNSIYVQRPGSRTDRFLSWFGNQLIIEHHTPTKKRYIHLKHVRACPVETNFC